MDDRRQTDRRSVVGHDDIANSLAAMSRALLGYPDPVSQVHVSGIADDVRALKRDVSVRNMIDSWILRLLLLLGLVRFLGWDHFRDLLQAFGVR